MTGPAMMALCVAAALAAMAPRQRRGGHQERQHGLPSRHLGQGRRERGSRRRAPYDRGALSHAGFGEGTRGPHAISPTTMECDLDPPREIGRGTHSKHISAISDCVVHCCSVYSTAIDHSSSQQLIHPICAFGAGGPTPHAPPHSGPNARVSNFEFRELTKTNLSVGQNNTRARLRSTYFRIRSETTARRHTESKGFGQRPESQGTNEG